MQNAVSFSLILALYVHSENSPIATCVNSDPQNPLISRNPEQAEKRQICARTYLAMAKTTAESSVKVSP